MEMPVLNGFDPMMIRLVEKICIFFYLRRIKHVFIPVDLLSRSRKPGIAAVTPVADFLI